MSSKFKTFLLSDAVIKSITSSGAGVARTNDGRVIFVKNCIPGDIVDLEVFKKKKNKLHGKILRFKFLNKDRVYAQMRAFWYLWWVQMAKHELQCPITSQRH